MADTKSVGAKCLTGLFLIFNFVFWITGLALLTVGVLMKVAFADFMLLSTDINYNIAPYIMIGCGVFIVLVGFCGCWAAMKSIHWALRIYMAVLAILFLVEIGGGVYGYVTRNKMHQGLMQGFSNGIRDYNNSTLKFKDVIDKFQRTSKCCGATTYTDWNVTLGENVVPKSCCKQQEGCAYADLSKGTTTIYTVGCVDQIFDFAKGKMYILGGVAIGIAVFQLLGILCAYCLTKFNHDETPYQNM